MANTGEPAAHPHPGPPAPLAWVRRFAPLVAPSGTVLDLACGGGRHARLFLARGHAVVALDIDVSGVADLMGRSDAEIIEADIEGGAWPLAGRTFAGVVVTNYLHRPLMKTLVGAVADGGVLLYQTFAAGNERYRRPRNPDHLLRRGELLNVVGGRFQVVAFEDGILAEGEDAAVVQRICAVKASARAPVAAEPRPLCPG